MKKIIFIGIVVLGIVVIFGPTIKNKLVFSPTESTVPEYQGGEGEGYVLQESALVNKLAVPWGITFINDDEFLYSERGGSITYVNGSESQVIYQVETVTTAEGGLLGITLHPDFPQTNFLYLYETYGGQNGTTLNRVMRHRFDRGEGAELSNPQVLIEDIPGAAYHDGGRIAFGPDGKLYITTGDATNSDLAQDLGSLAGKILRLNDDGTIPSDNPFPLGAAGGAKSSVYSYGHRNPQGLAWDNQGRLYSTEHGPSGLESGQDELNLIVAGGNYGWPYYSGTERPSEAGDSVIPEPRWPIAASGANDTWAPAGLTYWQGGLWFGGLRSEALFHYDLETQSLTRHLVGSLGRLRTTALTPAGDLAITTSNRDGRGDPKDRDDQIVIYSSL